MSSAPDAATIARRLEAVRARIAAAGGDPGRVTVLGVTKGVDAAVVVAAHEAGLDHFGENYADELVAKAEALADVAGISWHFIGQIQRNKLGRLAGRVACFETVAREVEGADIARRAPGTAVLVEVETTGLQGRGGIAPGAVGALVERLRGFDLDVHGLMTIAPPGAGAPAAAAFGLVGALCSDLGLPVCSMGMSDDLDLAVAAGSTEVRVGTALFGPRPP